ncbi:hypothetical protein RISK_002477 [Rhodopirellula islandica]|uniref:Uncharacterized protein n=1 Tax=Rhodopirellula islandica TaxID=595434 RepID=A0A0J1BH29_RHOIS|nr:hypothetical protein RISK_002477 [Rhodopirellula islandica]
MRMASSDGFTLLGTTNANVRGAASRTPEASAVPIERIRSWSDGHVTSI